MGDVDTFKPLIKELSDLRTEMLREEASLENRMDEICDLHRQSARNLVHYIALRRHDIRDLQEKLTENGLSSIGRAEAHVLGSVDAVLRVLRNLAGKAEATTDGPEAQPAPRDRELLGRNTDALLGPPPQD